MMEAKPELILNNSRIILFLEYLGKFFLPSLYEEAILNDLYWEKVSLLSDRAN